VQWDRQNAAVTSQRSGFPAAWSAKRTHQLTHHEMQRFDVFLERAQIRTFRTVSRLKWSADAGREVAVVSSAPRSFVDAVASDTTGSAVLDFE
jgi:phosphoserine phosphatase